MWKYVTELLKTNYPISFHRGPNIWMCHSVGNQVVEVTKPNSVTHKAYRQQQVYSIHTTVSCCKQSLTITVINYSSQTSELGGIVNTVDRGRSSLSHFEHPPLPSKVDNMFQRSTRRSEIFSKSGFEIVLEISILF